VPEGEMLRLIDVKTGQSVLTRVVQLEKKRAEELAAELERLQSLLIKAKHAKD
jgi:hypothetical protein